MEKATEMIVKFDELIKTSSNILVVCHTGADHDALSSLIATKEILVQHYAKMQTKAIGERIPNSLSFIPGYGGVVNTSIVEMLKKEAIDLVIFLDFSQWHLASKFDAEEIQQIITKNGIPLVVIDHHPETHKNIDADIYLNMDPTSTAMNLHLIFHKELNLEIKPVIADHLLYGIIADTNRFKYGYGAVSLTPLLHATADLLEHSTLTIEQIANSMERFDTKTLKVIATFSKNIKLHSATFAYTTLSEEDIAADLLDSTKLGDAALYVSNTLISMVDTAKHGVVIYPHLLEENTFTARFRSSDANFPVDKYAKALNGGGHPQSAAARIKAKDITEALEKVLAVAK